MSDPVHDPPAHAQEGPASASQDAPAPDAQSPAQSPTQSPTDASAVERRPVETWARDLRTDAWVFAAAKTMHRWPEGLEVSADDYHAACDAAQHEVIR
jgi:hypothetical protein